MSEYDLDYDDYIYDDGGFSDNRDDGAYQYETYDDFGIPTYDELDLEGRYYNYGSRTSYNQWRRGEIQRLRALYQPKQTFIPKKNPNNHIRMRHKPDELYSSDIPTYTELPAEEKKKYASREEYNNWRNKCITKKLKQRERKREAEEKRPYYVIICISILLVLLATIKWLDL